jgi:hypothetical protein
VILKFSLVYGHLLAGTVKVNDVDELKIDAAVIRAKTIIVYFPT